MTNVKSLKFILMSLLFLTILPINIQSESIVRNGPEIQNEQEEIVASGDGEIRVLHQPVLGQDLPSSFLQESDQRDPDDDETSSHVSLIAAHISPSTPIVVYGGRVEAKPSSEDAVGPNPESSNPNYHHDSFMSANNVITETRVEDTGMTTGKVMIWEEGVDLGTGDSATKSNSNSLAAASSQNGDQLPQPKSRDDDEEAGRTDSNVFGTVEIIVPQKQTTRKPETKKTPNDENRRSKNSANVANNLELRQSNSNAALRRHADVMWSVVVGFLTSVCILIHCQSFKRFSSSFSFNS